jgi:hypothetical protein
MRSEDTTVYIMTLRLGFIQNMLRARNTLPLETSSVSIVRQGQGSIDCCQFKHIYIYIYIYTCIKVLTSFFYMLIEMSADIFTWGFLISYRAFY